MSDGDRVQAYMLARKGGACHEGALKAAGIPRKVDFVARELAGAERPEALAAAGYSSATPSRTMCDLSAEARRMRSAADTLGDSVWLTEAHYSEEIDALTERVADLVRKRDAVCAMHLAETMGLFDEA